MTIITLSPEQFIFAQGEELKTTSLKISEAFNKKHGNVLRAIDNILTQVSDSFGELNFESSDYQQENNLGVMAKYRSYNLTRDGLMILVMGFTGKEAMAIKEWYINAFNLMHEKLFPKTQYGLKESPTLPAPRAKIYVKGGLELHQQDAINDFIKERVAIVPADKRKGITVMIYSAICIKFDVKGMKHGYKNIAPEQFDNIIQLIARLPIHDEKAMLFFTQDELDTLIAERVKAIEGELLPKETEPAEPGEKRFLIKIKGDQQTIEPIDINCYYMTEERSQSIGLKNQEKRNQEHLGKYPYLVVQGMNLLII